MKAKRVLKSTEPKEERLTIPRVDFKDAIITIQGTTPLMVQRFAEKAKRQIEEKQQKRAKTARETRDPHAEFMASMYVIPGAKKGQQYGIPAAGLKNCAVSACRFLDGVPMTKAIGSFHVLADGHGLIPIKTPGPTMDERPVRIGKFGNKVADMRYRARFDKWEIQFKVRFNPGLISPEQLANLYDTAGFSVGLCEYRPEKKGNMGMFQVKR